MAFEAHEAARTRAWLRMLLAGPSGSGKTYSSLLVASELARREGSFVGVVDAERGRSELYAGKVPAYKVGQLTQFSVQAYIDAMGYYAKLGCRVLIIDGISQAWENEGGVRDVVDNAVVKGQKGGFAGWQVGNKEQRRLVDAINRYPGHVICTSRVDTAWDYQKNERTGHMEPVAVGLKLVQRSNIDYEFALVLRIDADHNAKVYKTNYDTVASGAVYERPGVELAEQVYHFLREVDEGTAELSVEFDSAVAADLAAGTVPGTPEPVAPEPVAEPSPPAPTAGKANGHGTLPRTAQSLKAKADLLGISGPRWGALWQRSKGNLEQIATFLEQYEAPGGGSGGEAEVAAPQQDEPEPVEPVEVEAPAEEPTLPDAEPDADNLQGLDSLPEGVTSATEQQLASIGKIRVALGIPPLEGLISYEQAKRHISAISKRYQNVRNLQAGQPATAAAASS